MSTATSRITRLHLGHVSLPAAHPRASTNQQCPIFCFVVTHSDGLVVIDTGPRGGHELIDALYAPEVISIVDALNNAGFDERDTTAVVNSHLHFDHCGQNHLLPSAPVWVTAAEVEAATAEFSTVPEWAAIPSDRLRLAADGETIAEGVHILQTPGHTPGHVSVAVSDGEAVDLVAGQVCFTCAEFTAGTPAAEDMHDESWLDAGRESLRRLRAMNPRHVHLSHDAAVLA